MNKERLVPRLPGPPPAEHKGRTYDKSVASGGVVLAGGRSSRMGTPKAALEWHGSTLLRRTVGILARATDGPVVVVRASGQDLPALPKGAVVVDDPREGKGPVQGIAAGLAALRGEAETAFVTSTDLPFLHPAFVRRVLRVLGAPGDGPDVALPVARGYQQPLAAAYRTGLAGLAERLVKEDRLRPAFLFAECTVTRLDDATLLADPDLAARDPDLDSVLNVNTPEDYQAARRRRARGDRPAVRCPGEGRTAGRPAAGPRGDGPGRGRRGRPSARPARDGRAQRRPDHPGPADAAGGRRHRLLHVRRRGRVTQCDQLPSDQPPGHREATSARRSSPTSPTARPSRCRCRARCCAATRDETANAVAALGPPGIWCHGLAIKPGKPTLLAECGTGSDGWPGVPVIGLPGNPRSASWSSGWSACR